jgi:hypothetical protein
LIVGSAGLAWVGTASASSPQVFRSYVNGKARYTINYPASWRVSPTSGLDLFVTSPDHRAFLTASAIPVGGNTVTTAQIKQQQKSVLLGQHAMPSSMTFNVRRINGVSFLIAEGVARQVTGNRFMDLILVDSLHRGYIFDFNAGVLMKVQSTSAETKLLVNSLNTIRLK